MTLFKTLTRCRSDDAIEWIRFRVPGHRLNVLTPDAVMELAAALDEIDREAAAGRPPSAVVLTAEHDCGFFAGADLNRLSELLSAAASDTTAVVAATTAGRATFARLGSAVDGLSQTVEHPSQHSVGYFYRQRFSPEADPGSRKGQPAGSLKNLHGYSVN